MCFDTFDDFIKKIYSLKLYKTIKHNLYIYICEK